MVVIAREMVGKTLFQAFGEALESDNVNMSKSSYQNGRLLH